MRIHNMTLETIDTLILRLACGFTSMVLLLLFLLLPIGFDTCFAQESQPRMFSSPGEASDALFHAAQKEDEPALEAILGAGKEVTSSSDEEQDKLEREEFSKKISGMHPSSPRTRRKHGSVHRRRKLVLPDTVDL